MFRSVFCCAALLSLVSSLQIEDPATAAAGHLAETASWAQAATRSDSGAQSQSSCSELSEQEKKKACDDVGFGDTTARQGMMGMGGTLEDKCVAANPCCKWLKDARAINYDLPT